MAAAEVLRAKGLCFSYPGLAVLDHVEFSLKKGDFAGITGINGSGKSTLLKILLGLLPPAQGEVYWFGQSIRVFRNWPRVGYLPQNSAAPRDGFPANALEVVLTGMHSRMGALPFVGKRQTRIAEEALASLGVKDLAKRRIGELSGGQLQRVMLARTLVSKPDILLLDEPTTGVDPAAADALYSLLSGLNEKGLTILAVSHDIERIGAAAGRLFFMEEGRLTECNDDVHRQPPAHRHTHTEGGGA